MENDFIRRVAVRILLILAIIGSLPVACITTFFIADHSYKHEVHGELPGYFPIVVVTPGQAQIVWKENLATFIEEHPDYSFLVPPDKIEKYREQVRDNVRANQTPVNFDQSSPIPWDADFEMHSLSHGRQGFKVDATFDDDRMNVGWYEATDKEIFPTYHKFYFGPGLVLGLAPIVIGVTILSWIVGGFAFKYFQRRRARARLLPSAQSS